jgi:hypothetical protein
VPSGGLKCNLIHSFKGEMRKIITDNERKERE